MSQPAARSIGTALPHGPMTGRMMARRHGISERSNDVDVIMPTVSLWDQHFAIMTSPAPGRYELQLAFDLVEVERFYLQRVKTWSLIRSYGENDVYSSWYKLTDTRGEMMMEATATVERNHVAVLFPAWTDGIIGEVTWTEPAWARERLSVAERITLSLCSDELDAAWQAGDTEARLALFEDETCSVIRVVDVEGSRRFRAVAQSKAQLSEAWNSTTSGRIIEFERLARVTTSSYLFATYRMIIESGGRMVERETAAIFPLGPNLKFVGELSYSVEVEVGTS